MIETAGLLGPAIYENTEAWSGQDELQQDNYSLITLTKGPKFFRVISSLESHRVMGLMGIHDPDVLCHFSGMTHCPWCWKVGQNEGTVINHLHTVHYKLGLRCETCFSCPSITSEATHCHGQKSCLPSEEGGPDESSSLV